MSQRDAETGPSKPGKAIWDHGHLLTEFEKGEILDFKEIYFLSSKENKLPGASRYWDHNCGFDDDQGNY